jgi:hypothetical protein
LIALAQPRPDWAVACEDEGWGSRVAAPAGAAGTPAEAPLRLVEPSVPKGEPQALACAGRLVRGRPAAGAAAAAAAPDELGRRCVDGRPVRAVTGQDLPWAAAPAAARGLTPRLWVGDNASWHLSHAVRAAIRAHNQAAPRSGGVKVVPGWLPIQSPWLNPIEPKWTPGTRRVGEPARRRPAAEREARVYAALHARPTAPLPIPSPVACICTSGRS